MSDTRWSAEFDPDGVPHVRPLADLRPHALAADCWCGPTDDEGVLVHHSMDKREEFERGRQPS